MVSYYRHTCPRRLVVTGAPGAGKSVLALELMPALIEGREDEDPVPVRLSLAEWDTTIPLSARLARHLVDVYDWPAKMAGELIRQRRVLPVLDGLDEMDPTTPDGTPSPDAPRAQAALGALNVYQNGLGAGPVILTCRTPPLRSPGQEGGAQLFGGTVNFIRAQFPGGTVDLTGADGVAPTGLAPPNGTPAAGSQGGSPRRWRAERALPGR
ncbi:NACHT domain-containing protein [Streptomyces sp. NPDC052015]|uniref:NACHT domain-containing protein n=1 Tax=Streptomyces sp. NPDC052015 TaxID=3154755 RepID=UPI00342F2AB9